MVRRFQHPVFALQYDLSEGDRSRHGDREWYVQQLGGCRGHVLELAAGTGRITLPLVRAGVDVTAVDIALPMLQRLRDKDGSSVPSVCADMTRLPFAGPFDAALCGYNSLGCLLEPDQLRRCFAEVRRVLRPGARFLFDVPKPGPIRGDREEQWGAVRRRSRVLATEPHLKLEYHFFWEGGEEKVLFELNLWPPDFYVAEARDAGFGVDGVREDDRWAFVALTADRNEVPR